MPGYTVEKCGRAAERRSKRLPAIGEREPRNQEIGRKRGAVQYRLRRTLTLRPATMQCTGSLAQHAIGRIIRQAASQIQTVGHGSSLGQSHTLSPHAKQATSQIVNFEREKRVRYSTSNRKQPPARVEPRPRPLLAHLRITERDCSINICRARVSVNSGAVSCPSLPTRTGHYII